MLADVEVKLDLLCTSTLSVCRRGLTHMDVRPETLLSDISRNFSVDHILIPVYFKDLDQTVCEF